MARIVFMGTPEFAVPALQKLHESYGLVAVVTQPDRRAGRGKRIFASPVKQAATKLGIPVLQPPNLRKKEAIAALAAYQPDLIIVAAFGQILRTPVLTLPEYGCLNIHASLLPRWRGAAPVAYAIRAGDQETGISIMKMDRGLDTGPVLSQRSVPISPTHTGGSLTKDLAHVGADLLLETVPGWLAGSIEAQPQDDGQATLAPRIDKLEGQIDWHAEAAAIERHVRAFQPWPGTFTYWQDTLLKIHQVRVLMEDTLPGQAPGSVFRVEQEIAVATGQGAVVLVQVQPAGKRVMPTADFVRGASAFVGSQLGFAPSS